MKINEVLERDTHRLGRFDHSAVLLHRNAIIPWFILVPDTSETEFLALPAEFRAQLVEESARTGRFVQGHFGCPKINFAAIGNIVAQLHLHVVGRDPADCCWPNPVWGHLTETKPWADADVSVITDRFTANYDLQPFP